MLEGVVCVVHQPVSVSQCEYDQITVRFRTSGDRGKCPLSDYEQDKQKN